jgi:hypothetical protein
VVGDRGEDPAINRCRQVRDRTALRGHAAFAGWCSSAARCCSLRSKLRSPGGSPAPCVLTKGGAHLTPQKQATLPYDDRSAPQPRFTRCRWCPVVVCVVVTAVVSSRWWTGSASPHRRPPPTDASAAATNPLPGGGRPSPPPSPGANTVRSAMFEGPFNAARAAYNSPSLPSERGDRSSSPYEGPSRVERACERYAP